MTPDLTLAIVRILAADGGTAGTGFLVDAGGLIATCAHVVRDAGAGPGGVVRLSLHATGELRQAQVVPEWWRAPEAEDIAILHLDGPVPVTCRAIQLAATESGLAGARFRAFGYPAMGEIQGLHATGPIQGVVTAGAGRRLLQLSSPDLAPGMSGAPVVEESSGLAAGMVSAVYHPDATTKFRDSAYATPAEVLHRICPRLKLHILPLHPDEQPVVIATLTNAEAKELFEKKVFEGYPPEVRQEFVQLEAKLHERGFDWQMQYRGQKGEWCPFIDGPDINTIVGMLSREVHRERSFKPVMLDLALVCQEEWLLKGLRDEGGVMILDMIALRHPAIQRELLSSSLAFYPSIAIAYISPFDDVKNLSHHLLGFVQSYSESELHRRLNVFLDINCDHACEEAGLKRWLIRHSEKKASTSIRDHYWG